MPYEIKMQGGKHCVYNKSTGDNKGCSDTHAKAVAHMRALYAAEKDLGISSTVLEVDGKLEFKAVDEAHTHEHTHYHYHEHEHDGESHSHGHNHVHEHEHDHSEYSHSHYHTMHESNNEAHDHNDDQDHAHGASYMSMEEQPAAPSSKSKDVSCGCLACVADDDEGALRVKAQMTRKAINDLPNSSFAYIEPGCDTKSCRHFPIHDKAHVRNALARLSQSPYGPKAKAKVMAAAKRMGISQDKSLLSRMWAMMGSHTPVERGPLQLIVKEGSQLRVIMRVSNMFKDRHGEIITSEAHKDYVNWVDADSATRMPEFWLWHTKGTRWGKADWLDYDESGFLIASGLVDEGYEHVAETLASMDKEIGVSHGFFGLSLQNKGYIDLYRSFEFSPLPIDQAANVWTAYMLAKEVDLPISDAKRKFFIDDLGIPEDVITRIEQDNKSEADAIKALGIDYKTNGDSDGDTSHSTDGAADSNVGSGPTLADVLAKLDGIIEDLSEVKAKQKALEGTDAVANALAAAVVPGGLPGGYIPSQAKDNTSKDDDQKAAEGNWWDEVVMKPLIGGRS